MNEPLNDSLPKALKEAVGVDYSAEKYDVFITTLGAEPGIDVPLLIPLDLTKKPSELFLVDSDVIVLKELPPFKGIVDKFPECDTMEKTTLMLACDFAAEPLLPMGDKPVDLNELAKGLGVSEDLLKEYKQRAANNAEYGPISVLIELQDRLSHVKINPLYSKDAFDSEKSYNDWCIDEREDLLTLVRQVLFDSKYFCAEVHIRVSADGITSADVSGLSDPYCRIIYKTQIQSTHVTMATLHPKWDEEFVFSVSSIDKPMTFNIYDWDPISAHDYLGSATLAFREHIDLLDGDKHVVTLPLNKKGEVTVEVQAHYENSRFLKPFPGERPISKLNYQAVYKNLYSVLHEADNISPETPWLLRELIARCGVSELVGASMKLEDLLKKEPTIDPDFSKCLFNNAMKLMRPTEVPNREESKIIAQHIGTLYEYLRDKYMPYCFCNKDTTRPVMETSVHLFVECCIAAKKTEEMENVLIKCVNTGVRGQCDLLTSEIAWNDEEKVCEDVRTLVCDKLLNFFDALHSMYENIMPLNIKPNIFKALVTVFGDCVNNCYGNLCTELCKLEKPHQGPVYAIMQATATLSNNIHERTGIQLEIKAAKAVFQLWVKASEPILANWVERAISVDKYVPLQAGLLHSSSVVDVSEACSQIITQLKPLVIPDMFIWVQAAEVVANAMDSYFNLQKKVAQQVIQTQKSTLFDDDARALQKVCICIGNIEKGQELLDTIVSTVEGSMEAMNKESEGKNEDKDKDKQGSLFDVYNQSLSTSISGVMKSAQSCISDPLCVLAAAICSPVSTAITQGLASETGISEDALSNITGQFDEAIGAAHGYLSKRSFRMFLLNCWLISSDTISKAIPPTAEANGPKKGMNVAAVRDSVENTMNTLYEYFHPEEGEGLTQAQLDASRGYVNTKRLICLYRQNTESLIALTRGFTAKPKRLPEEVDPLLKGTVLSEVEMIIKTRIDEGDLWARAYAKEMSGSDDSQDVRDHFSLPPSELLLDRWVCSVGRKAGTLYLLSRHLCFDTAFSKAMNDTTSVVIMLEDIISMEEVSQMLVFKGIKITVDHMSEEEVPVFSKFVTKAQDVIAAIRAQALLVNNKHLAPKDGKDR